MNSKRYHTFARFLRERFGQKVLKICIDGGFSCPNRDGTCGTGGCVYCGERGAGEHLDATLSIRQQVTNFINRKPASGTNELYIAYFQSFTNTYASPSDLRERYDQALIDDRIVALAIGTRPDCIDETKAALLAEYLQKRYVWVELGLQTANDNTATLINRGYPSCRFTEAVEILSRFKIDVVAHLIIGLPGETFDDLRRSVDFINRHPIQGIKIHSLYVMDGTLLADWYRQGRFTTLTRNEYIERAVYVLTHINPDLTVHRLTGDCQPDLLVAPEWNRNKNEILSEIDNKLEENNYTQGCFFE